MIEPIWEHPYLRPLGRFHPETARRAGVLPLFWSGSGVELLCSGSELYVTLEAGFSEMAPWVAAEINGALLLRLPLNRGSNELCVFQGLTAKPSASAGTRRASPCWKRPPWTF